MIKSGVLLLFLLIMTTLADKSVIKNVKVIEGKLKFNCIFKLIHTETTVSIKQSSAVCTPGKPKNKGPLEVKVEFGKLQFTISLKINPEKIVSASVNIIGGSGSESGSGIVSGSGSGNGNETGFLHESVVSHSPWGEWGDCSGCSNVTERSRVETEKKTCNGETGLDGWSSWSEWSSCLSEESYNIDSCQWNENYDIYGIKQRRRFCTHPTKNSCPGQAVELERCVEICCKNYTQVACPKLSHTFNALVVQLPNGPSLDVDPQQSTEMSIRKFTTDYACRQSRLTNEQTWSFDLRSPSISYFDSNLYFCSGYYHSGNHYTQTMDCTSLVGRDSCMILDPLNEKWTELSAKLNIPRTGHVSVALGDTLYVLGGHSASYPSWCTDSQETFPREVEKYKVGFSSFEIESWTLDDLGFSPKSQPFKTCSLALGDKILLGHLDTSSMFRIILVGRDGEVTEIPPITFNGTQAFRWAELACTVVESKLMVVSKIVNFDRNTGARQAGNMEIILQTSILDIDTLTWEKYFPHTLYTRPWWDGAGASIFDLKTLDGVPIMVTQYRGYNFVQWKDEQWIHYPVPTIQTSGSVEFFPIPVQNLNQKC